MKERDLILRISTLEALISFDQNIESLGLWNSQNTITQEGVTHILKLCNAFWKHPGDQRAPHVELSSGLHTNGFIDISRVIQYPSVCDILVHHMVQKIEKFLNKIDYTIPIRWIVGSDHAGAIFSYGVARWLRAKHASTERSLGGLHLLRNRIIEKDQPILQVEAHMVTGRTIQGVREALFRGNPNPIIFTPLVATLVNQSHISNLAGSGGPAPVVHLAHYETKRWEPKDCHLCKIGSKAIKEPKKNWGELTGK